MKKVGIILLLGLMMLVTACGSDSTNEEESDGNTGNTNEEEFVVGIVQYVEHPSLDAATEGFKDALNESGLNITFDEENAQADAKNNKAIAEKFVGDNVDLIFANATASAQSAVNETDEIPVVFTSVTDPVGSEIIEDMDAPGGNATGTSDSNPEAIPSTLQMIKDMGYEKIGTIYNSGESNSVTQIEQMKEEASKLDLTIEEAVVTTSAEVKQATESLIGSVEVFYVITDNTVVEALESVIMVSEQEKLPLFVGELDSVKRGGFAGFGFSYYDIGYEAGEKAIQILKGEKTPAEIPATFPQNLQLEINEDAAEKMGVEITPDLEEKATIVQTKPQD